MKNSEEFLRARTLSSVLTVVVKSARPSRRREGPLFNSLLGRNIVIGKVAKSFRVF